jgi:hypothetical protein
MLQMLLGFAFAGNVPMFGQAATTPAPVGGPRVVYFVVQGPAPAAVPRVEAGRWDVPAGPVRATISAEGSALWRERVRVAAPGSFVAIDQLGSPFQPVPTAPVRSVEPEP